MHSFQTTKHAAAVALAVATAVLLLAAWQPLAPAPKALHLAYSANPTSVVLTLEGPATHTLTHGKGITLPLETYALHFDYNGMRFTQPGLNFARLFAAHPNAERMVLRVTAASETSLAYELSGQEGATTYTVFSETLVPLVKAAEPTEKPRAENDEQYETGLDGLGYGGQQMPAQSAHKSKRHAKDNTYYEPGDNLPDSGGEEFGKLEPNKFVAVQQKPLSTFSIDVDRASYAFMRRYLMNGSLPPADAVRLEELINYFPYNYKRPAAGAEHPFAVNTEVATCPWAPSHQLVRIGIAGQAIETNNLPPSNLVFLLDVSGSMEADNKLPLLKSALALLLPNLRPQDHVAIVVYAGAAGLVLPSTSAAQQEVILAAMEKLTAGGSTAGGAGIELAYKVAEQNFMKGGNNRIVLCTDGDFNVGTSSESGLTTLIEEKRKSGVFLTVLGFGMGNTKDNFMEILADKGNGNYAYIDNLLEARKTLVEELGGTLVTIAKDVKLQVEFNPATVKGYRLIGYENRLLRDEDFADDTKDAGELGAGHTVTALYEIIPAGSEEEIPGATELKYQDAPKGSGSELLTVSLRYKAPDGDTSKLLAYPVAGSSTGWEKATEDFRFVAGVASFGMTLRRDTLRGSSSYTQALQLAQAGSSNDAGGYRHELIQLIQLAQSLDRRPAD